MTKARKTMPVTQGHVFVVAPDGWQWLVRLEYRPGGQGKPTKLFTARGYNSPGGACRAARAMQRNIGAATVERQA